jgi:hypothetical protein
MLSVHSAAEHCSNSMAGTVQFGRLVDSTACCRLSTRLETHGLTISWYSPSDPYANTCCAATGGCLESAVYTNQLACAVGSVVLVYDLSHFKVYVCPVINLQQCHLM